MGLSSLPAPSEGMLCIVLVNTALSICMFKGIVRSILHVVGIRPSSPPSPPTSSLETPSEHFDFRFHPSDTYIEELKNQMPTSRFKSLCGCENQSGHDCSVCLTKFDPESEISKLNCGHLFHKACLEKWIDYGNITCPMCRTPLVPEEETSSSFW